MRSRWSILAMMTLADPVAAQTIPPAAKDIAAPAGKWEIDYGDWHCTLSRALTISGKPARFALALEPLDATSWAKLVTTGGGGPSNDGDAVMLVDGVRVPGTLHYNLKFSRTERLREYMLDMSRHHLGDARTAIRFWTQRDGDFEVQLPGFPTAWKALQACMKDLHASLGIDPAEVAQVTKKAEGRVFDQVQYRGGESEFALVYWIAADGRVDKCRMLKASGRPELDKSLCDEIVAKARFRPALDARGQPVRAPQYEYFRIIGRQVRTPG